MGSFLEAATSYPTAIYSALLGVVLIYWMLAIVGLVDIESGGLEIDVGSHIDGEVPDVGTVAGYMVAFGLTGVPFSLSISLLVLIAWTVACLAGMWLLPAVPGGALQWLAGSGVLLGSAALAIPGTTLAIRPLRGLFASNDAPRHVSLIGQACTVRTLKVDDRFGQAEVETRGAIALINVRAATPNTLTKGSAARILRYDAQADRYDIRPETDLLEA